MCMLFRSLSLHPARSPRLKFDLEDLSSGFFYSFFRGTTGLILTPSVKGDRDTSPKQVPGYRLLPGGVAHDHLPDAVEGRSSALLESIESLGPVLLSQVSALKAIGRPTHRDPTAPV